VQSVERLLHEVPPNVEALKARVYDRKSSKN
jgi:hypothetical protein